MYDGGIMNSIKSMINYLQNKFAAFMKLFSKNESSSGTDTQKYQHIHSTNGIINDTPIICDYLAEYTNFPLKVIVDIRNGIKSFEAQDVTQISEILNIARDNGICVALSLSPGYKRLVITPVIESNPMYQFTQIA